MNYIYIILSYLLILYFLIFIFKFISFLVIKNFINISILYLRICLLFLKNLQNSFIKIVFLICIYLKLVVSISFIIEHDFKTYCFLHHKTDYKSHAE